MITTVRLGEPAAWLESQPTRPTATKRHSVAPTSSRPTVRVKRVKAFQEPVSRGHTLVSTFIEYFKELEGYKNGQPVTVDGRTLSISAVAAAARFHASVTLDTSTEVVERVRKSRVAIANKVKAGISVYGVSTGFGGSADTRTGDPLTLGSALLQHQHCGVLPSSSAVSLSVLPLLDPLTSSSMPESWVRGAILVRMNSLIRGHSGVRWELIEKLGELLRENITPLVPLRTSISASGDLSPLSYIAGTLIGNPSIRVFDGPPRAGAPRQIVPSRQALADHGVAPLTLASKEHLGILNGTAFSASTAALALNDAVHLTLLSTVLTAMATEALCGVRGSYHPFIHSVARPHPGQVEAARIIWDLLEGSSFACMHETECHIDDDNGELRQDRYPLRTAPQFLGPQIEDILHALSVVTQECNSTTDNPLIDGETGTVHHGGNFQAMAVSNAMEKTRLALHHVGKIMMAQATELCNPSMNRGLPPNLAASDPSLNFAMKGVDIAVAAYVSELGYLANPVTTHIQSAEMHNQAVNSLALISARATINALEVLSMLMASYLYALCQALDLRALQAEFDGRLEAIVREELERAFGAATADGLRPKIMRGMRSALEASGKMDGATRMRFVAEASSGTLLAFFSAAAAAAGDADAPPAACAQVTGAGALGRVPEFQAAVARRAEELLAELRRSYLSGARGRAPASACLGKTRTVYEYVRGALGIRMHGLKNLAWSQAERSVGALEAQIEAEIEEETIGQDVSRIYEAIRDGQLHGVIVGLFDSTHAL